MKLLQVFSENLIKLVGAEKDIDIDIDIEKEKDKDTDTEYVLSVFRSKSFWFLQKPNGFFEKLKKPIKIKT